LAVDGALDEVGWDGPLREKLWRYNQHYFDDLNARDAVHRREWHGELIADWLAGNPPAEGSGWEPYPTSLRIVNWIKWALAGHALPAAALQSLAVQTRWLRQRLEIHLLGNHLFANAKALVFAGLFFEGREADAWLKKGLDILRREIPEQILADGGQFERSPMYHALALEDVLDLVNLTRCYGVDRDEGQFVEAAGWPALAERMLDWLRVMCHPDGEISLFNDAAMGIAPELEELAAYAERLGLKRHEPGANGGIASPVAVNCRELRDSGYVRLESAGAVALLDVGPVGPDYLPGHAHADTLSFECSIFGRRVIVNGGTSRYGGGKEFTDRRLFERSTRNHSTVEIAGESSSEVWGSFRVARRAYPMDLAVRCAAESVLVDCSHDGYRRLPGHPVHRRVWRMEARRLSVEDWVSGELPAVARFILHPDVRVERQANNRLVLTVGGGDSVSLLVVEGGLSLQQVHYASCFGVLRETACVEIALVSGRCAVSLEW
jgi:uncharacterized heparinase superfamily protein